MDYEKKYKALVEAAKTLKEANPSDEGIQNWVNDNVPELKESEDERIRKALINGFNKLDKSAVWYNGITNAQILAWLEKQGKIVDYYEDRLDECACKYFNKGYKQALEKQGEQKPTDKIEPKFKVGDKIQYLKGCGTIMTIEKIENDEYVFANNLGHTTIEDGNKWYLVERNPTWSEDDDYYHGIIQYILNNECVGKTDKENAIKWFNSLKDRVLPQPKQEWSEEDETVLDNLIYALANDRIGNDRDEYVTWLKSLRPQNRWKPSDKQMNTLWDIISNDNLPNNEKEISQQVALTELYEQLKKL